MSLSVVQRRRHQALASQASHQQHSTRVRPTSWVTMSGAHNGLRLVAAEFRIGAGRGCWGGNSQRQLCWRGCRACLAPQSGLTALIAAALSGRVGAMALLLDRGADLHAKTTVRPSLARRLPAGMLESGSHGADHDTGPWPMGAVSHPTCRRTAACNSPESGACPHSCFRRCPFLHCVWGRDAASSTARRVWSVFQAARSRTRTGERHVACKHRLARGMNAGTAQLLTGCNRMVVARATHRRMA